MDKNILKEYTSKVDQLNTAFQDLIANNLIPIIHGEKSYTVENVKEVQDNLEKQEFTISVCGQINAGKSSFLNYLLFHGEEVLPADDTPWTAKLTTIRYEDENQATVTYYNIEEWEALKRQKITKDSGVAISYYDEFLKDEVNNAALNGLHAESFIVANNKTVRGIALNDLSNYVAKGGSKTPFVKLVDIGVNNELVKGVVFVDTPGINDRNELRSKVTEDWIKKSCSVTYLFYAGQALSSADYEFIDQHLSSVPSDKILFALTKADISADYEGAKYFVESTLIEDEELKKRKFITDNKSVYPISTLSALINYKQLNNIKLNEDEEFHLERIMEVCPSFIKNNGFIEEFVNALRSQLMTQTGKAIINKTTEFLFDIYKTNELSLLSYLNTTKDKLQSLNLSDVELNGKRDSLKKKLDEIEKFKRQFKRNVIEERIGALKTSLEVKLTEFRKSGWESLNGSLEDAANDSVESLRDIAIHLTRQKLTESSNKIHHSILNDLSVKDEINSLLETFSNKFQTIVSDIQVYEGSLSCYVENPSAIVSNLSFNQLAVEKLKETCGKYYLIFNKNKVQSLVINAIKKTFDSYMDNIIKTVIANTENVIEENINEVYNNVGTEVKKLKSNTEDLLKRTKGLDEEKSILQEEVVNTQERLDYIMYHFNKTKACL